MFQLKLRVTRVCSDELSEGLVHQVSLYGTYPENAATDDADLIVDVNMALTKDQFEKFKLGGTCILTLEPVDRASLFIERAHLNDRRQ